MSSRIGGKENMACCGGQAVHLRQKVRDPLCGNSVAVDSPYRLNQEGRSQRFCSEACLVDYTRAMQGEVVPGVAFNCAMHPETRQTQPGECAVCGMTLAPVRITVAGNSPTGPVRGVLGRLRAALRL